MAKSLTAANYLDMDVFILRLKIAMTGLYAEPVTYR